MLNYLLVICKMSSSTFTLEDISDVSFESESDDDASTYYSVFAASSDELEEEVEEGEARDVDDVVVVEVEDYGSLPGSAVLVPEVERLVTESFEDPNSRRGLVAESFVDPNNRRGQLVVAGYLITGVDLGFQLSEPEVTREERSARVRELTMFKHTIDMTISSLQVSFVVLVIFRFYFSKAFFSL